MATRYSAGGIMRQFRRLPFQPYAPVRKQLLEILEEVNRLRRAKGLEPVPPTSVRWKRWIVKPFGEGEWPDSPERVAGRAGGPAGSSGDATGRKARPNPARTR